MPHILVVGSANVDYTVAVRRLPRPGETVSNGALLIAHGGKGANQAVAARRLGAEVRFIGCVGDDAAGAGIRAALARDGIDTSKIVTAADAATGTALIVVDADGRNQIAVAPGANRALSVERMTAADADFAWADVVMTQLETPLPTVRWVLEQARRHDALTMLNPAPVPEAALDLWSLVDYLTPNAIEAERLSGCRVEDAAGAVRAASVLRGQGVGTIVVTLGGEGALISGDAGTKAVPGWRVDVVDTTAAGDAFNGALAVALAEGCEFVDAVRFANAAAALACTRRGAQPSLPTRVDVERLLRG